MSLEFLLEMGWKSAAICAVTLVLLYVLRSRSAADRAAVLRLSVLLLLLLPIVSLALPKLEIEAFAESAPAAPAEPPLAHAAPLPLVSEVPAEGVLDGAVPVEPEAAALSLGLSILLLYAAGAALVLARLLAGLWTLRRWTAGAEAVLSPAWTDAFQRAVAANALKREVRLLVSPDVPSPMSWGRRRPVILIDRASQGRPADAEAILAHEMAHIRRGDWPSLMLSRVAVALFWFNPLVWLIERSLIQQAEEAADLQAVNGLEPARYAQSLIACIRCSGLHAVPANGMARADGLSRRIHAVLDARLRQMPSGSVLTAGVMLVSVLVSTPLAAVKLVAAEAAQAEPDATQAPAAAVPAPADDPRAFAVAAPAPAVPAQPPTVQAPGEPLNLAAPAPAPAPMPELAFRQASHAPAAPAVPHPPRAAAASRLDIDTLVQLQVHGIDAEYIEAMQRARGTRFTPRQLVDLRVHGVTPAKVRGYEELGLRLSHEQLLEMAVHGVSPAYIRSLAAAGYQGLGAAQLVEMRIHGVSAADARKGRELGLTPQQLVRMKILGGL